MEQNTIYADIASRTGGNIYIGVVGPVRTGKSTFIKRFMQTLVLPHLKDDILKSSINNTTIVSMIGRDLKVP